MAVISKIRQQSLLLLVVVGLAMVLFILGDILSSNSNFFQQQETHIGEINGFKVDYIEFNTRVEKYIAERMAGQNVDETMREQIRMQVWNSFIEDLAYQPVYNELGIAVSDEELVDIITNNPNNPTLKRYFSNRQGQVFEQFRDPVTGGLNGEAVLQYLKGNVYSGNPEAAQAKAQWLAFKEAWKNSREAEKLSTLLSKGMYATTLEAQETYVNKNKKIDFSYVLKPYSFIADSSIQVDQSDLSAYYQEHKHEERFQQNETTRSLEYIVFDVVPSEEDINTIRQSLIDLKPAFENTNDDTLFVTENAETPFNINYYTEGSFPEEIDSLVFSAEENTVIGPYREGEAFKLAKVKSSTFSPDSVKARHILVSIEEGDTASARATIDSLQQVIEANDNFSEMAQQFSEDPGSAAKGGDLGWFTEGQMVPAFNDACFNGEIGDMEVVYTQYGVHLINITGQTDDVEKRIVAIVDVSIQPGDETYEKVYNDANNFYINNSTAEAFRENGEPYGIQFAPNIRLNDRALGGFENPRTLISWAYNNEVGTVSEPFAMGDQYVVALLTEVKEEGTLPLESVEDQIEIEVIREKKAAQLIQEMAGTTDLSALASKVGAEVQTASEANFNAMSIRGLGNEPKVQGIAFTLGEGQVSVPIQGNRGVYVIRIDKVTEPAMEAIPLKSEKEQLEAQLAQRMQFQAQRVLKETADIIDNRGKFF